MVYSNLFYFEMQLQWSLDWEESLWEMKLDFLKYWTGYFYVD